ncbi:MAG: RDD family protein [Pirellulales bacterium]
MLIKSAKMSGSDVRQDWDWQRSDPYNMPAATRWDRAVTFELDSLILAALCGAGYFVMPATISEQVHSVFQNHPRGLMLFWFLVICTVIVAYYALFETFWYQSPGKMITRTRVVDRFGDNPWVGQILIRSVCRLIPLEAISYLVLKNAPLGLHDLLPGTRVIKKPAKSSSSRSSNRDSAGSTKRTSKPESKSESKA